MIDVNFDKKNLQQNNVLDNSKIVKIIVEIFFIFENWLI